MSANHRPSATAGGSVRRARQAPGLLVLSSFLAIAPLHAQEHTAPPGEASGKEQIPTVLQQQEIGFFYRSSIAPLSCSDLRARVASIFRALGAREDVRVDVLGC